MVRSKFALGVMSAALMVVTLVGIGAQPASAATSIVAKVEKNELDQGSGSYVVGNVNPRRAGEMVILERGFPSGAWSERGRQATDANGAFRILIRPTDTGIYKFRVRSGSVSSPVFYVRVWKLTYLSDIRSVGGGYCCWINGSAKINGVTFARSIRHDDRFASFREYDLGRAYKRFSAVVGVTDDSASGSTIAYRILADGQVLAQGTVGLGQPQTVDVSVSGRLRLRVEYTTGPKTCSPAFGNARIKV